MRRCALVASVWGLRDSLNPKIPFPHLHTLWFFTGGNASC